MGARRPLILAHRGASHHAPENTLRAVQRAAELGADGVEVDLQRCATGEVVVFHDADTQRFGGVGAVTHLPLAELRRLDVGEGERVPTLDELLEAAPAGLFLVMELKHDRLRTGGLEAAVVDRLRAHRRRDGVLLCSFNPGCLLRLRRLSPDLPVGFLFHRKQSWAWRRGWVRLLRPHSVHPEHPLVDSVFLDRARRRGHRVYPWTCDRPEDLRRLLALGVDGIITNRPDLLDEELGGRRRPTPPRSQGENGVDPPWPLC